MKETASTENINKLIDYFENMNVSNVSDVWETECLQKMKGNIHAHQQQRKGVSFLLLLLVMNCLVLISNHYHLKQEANFSKERNYKAISHLLFVNPS